MRRIILLTAWNDSGAGHLCRYLDGSKELNILPFETLLGSACIAGISSFSELVHPWYRWNLFRDETSVDSFFDFEEPELMSWLSNEKFNILPHFRKPIIRARSEFYKAISVDQSNFLNATRNYIFTISQTFFPDSNADILVHVPCAMLDSYHPNFKKLFDKVVVVFINPLCGYINMNKRNGITPSRYFQRWKIINSLSLKYTHENFGNTCLISNTLNRKSFVNNSKTIFEFLNLPSSSCLEKPTLLGEYLKNPFYPFGGLLSLDNKIKDISALAHQLNSEVLDNERDLQLECSLMYAALQHHAK